MESVPRFALMSLAQTQMIQRTCSTKTMKQFHEHFSTVRELLPIQLRAPVGVLQIPRSIKFLYTYSTFFSNRQDLTKHMGGTYTRGKGGRDLSLGTVDYAKYDKDNPRGTMIQIHVCRCLIQMWIGIIVPQEIQSLFLSPSLPSLHVIMSLCECCVYPLCVCVACRWCGSGPTYSGNPWSCLMSSWNNTIRFCSTIHISVIKTVYTCMHVSPSWERDPSSVALPEGFFHFFHN